MFANIFKSKARRAVELEIEVVTEVVNKLIRALCNKVEAEGRTADYDGCTTFEHAYLTALFNFRRVLPVAAAEANNPRELIDLLGGAAGDAHQRSLDSIIDNLNDVARARYDAATSEAERATVIAIYIGQADEGRHAAINILLSCLELRHSHLAK